MMIRHVTAEVADCWLDGSGRRGNRFGGGRCNSPTEYLSFWRGMLLRCPWGGQTKD
jgi:hypothetical protein